MVGKTLEKTTTFSDHSSRHITPLITKASNVETRVQEVKQKEGEVFGTFLFSSKSRKRSYLPFKMLMLGEVTNDFTETFLEIVSLSVHVCDLPERRSYIPELV